MATARDRRLLLTHPLRNRPSSSHHLPPPLPPQIATLYIMHLHGWSRAQVAELAREHPTWLRALKLQ